VANERNAEQQARRVVRNVEPDLCRHLGVSRLDPDFVAELYIRVREELLRSSSGGAVTGDEDSSSSLALTIFLVTTSQQEGSVVSPELIPRLETVIARTLSATQRDPSAERPAGRERRVR
jgi:hypothetical protein